MPSPNRIRNHLQELNLIRDSADPTKGLPDEMLGMRNFPGSVWEFPSFTEAFTIREETHRQLLRHCAESLQDPRSKFFSQFLRLLTSELASVYREKKTESVELKSLKKEIQALKKRLDAFDAMFEEARRLDKEIEAEIEAIEAEPVNPLDYKPEDWLPTPEERERLLEDE